MRLAPMGGPHSRVCAFLTLHLAPHQHQLKRVIVVPESSVESQYFGEVDFHTYFQNPSLGTIIICILYVIMPLCKEENEDQKYWSSIPSLTARPYRTTAKPWLIMQNCCDYFGINIAKLSLNFSLTLLS